MALGKKQLPVIPQSSFLGYKFSGKIPKKGIFAVLIGGVLCLSIVGPFISTIGTGLYFLIFALFSSQHSSGWMKLAGVVCVFAYPIIISLFAGYGFGFYSYLTAVFGNVRNKKMAGIYSFTIGFVSVASFPICVRVLNSYGILGPKYMLLNVEKSAYIIYTLLGLVSGFVSALAAKELLSELPYCEKCDKWFRKLNKKSCSIDLAEPLARDIVSGKVDSNRYSVVGRVTETDYPRLSVKITKCPDNCDNVVLLKIKHIFKVQKIINKQVTDVNEEEKWIQGTVPAEIGKKLLELLC